MGRRMLIVFAVAGILLSLCTALLWKRSFSRRDIVDIALWTRVHPREKGWHEQFMITWIADRGGLSCWLYWQGLDELQKPRSWLLSWDSGRSSVYAWFASRPTGPPVPGGFQFRVNYREYSNETPMPLIVTAPLWLVFIVVLLSGLVCVRLLIRRRARGLKGMCLHCGYDLRATPDRCPECGMLLMKYTSQRREHHAEMEVWKIGTIGTRESTLYYPQHACWTTSDPEFGRVVYDLQVDAFDPAVNATDDTFRVIFPFGTRVLDRDNNVTFTADGKGGAIPRPPLVRN